MPSKSARPRRRDLREIPAARRVAIVAFPGVTLLDISGPAQVFAELQKIAPSSAGYSLSYLSTSGGLVQTDVGMMVDTAPISSVSPHQVDTLVIPGGPGIWQLRQDPLLMDWISEVLPQARRIASVCLGAFVLAWTGVLDGKRAGTHWRYCPRLGGRLLQNPRRAECDFRKRRACLVIGRRERWYRPRARHDRRGFRPYHRPRHRAAAGCVS